MPQFTRIARSYLLQAWSLDWQHINPNIFGSMIEAVADDAGRAALGMDYTSVPHDRGGDQQAEGEPMLPS